MSMTSTEPSHTISELQLLAAYEVHHTGTEDEEHQIEDVSPPLPDQEGSQRHWLTGYRAIPGFRSTDRQTDYWERAAGRDSVEGGFVMTAFLGLYINAAITRVWRKTGGRINERIFRYDVGGEW